MENTPLSAVYSLQHVGCSSTTIISLSGQTISLKLDAGNFLLWKQQIWVTIAGYELEHFLTGEVTPPEKYIPDSSDSETILNPQFLAWNKQDQLIISWLISSMSESILVGIVGLGPEYNSVMVPMTSRAESFPLKEVKGLLLIYEKRLESMENPSFGLDGSSPLANIASSHQQSRNVNFQHMNRGQGNDSGQGRGNGNNRGGYSGGKGGRNNGNYKPKCQICHIVGHTADRCYEHMNPDFTPTNTNNHGGVNMEVALQHTYITNVPGHSTDVGSEMSWYPDSGVTNHVTYDISNLNMATDYQRSERLQMGNGVGLRILHIGDSIVRVPANNSNHAFLLKNLLHVPLIKKNLLSVSQFACDNRVLFEFHPTFCLVKDPTSGATLLHRKVENDLYSFKLSNT
ncbi:hypothetical protein C2S52_001674 [Perilla frutescens var. hirtella]|nr:hypothetical protein C2S52_001674 [Perilla frutescens var. hirtella]